MGDIAKTVVRLRRKAGFTQVQLAVKAGISPVTVSRVERGSVSPTWEVLEKLAVALNVKTERLFKEMAQRR